MLGLKNLPGALVSSIVSMSDDGGSSGRLRASFGVLPPGDVRRSLVALSNAPQLMNEVLQHRFKRGGNELGGHSFGNLFLTALSEIKGSMSEAVRALGDILNIQGVVFPVTSKDTTLCAEFEGGLVVKGESRIDLGFGRNPDLPIRRLWHDPVVSCDPGVYSSMVNADFLVIGPGDLYSSIITNLLVKGVQKHFAFPRQKIYICNLMTKPGETSGYDVAAHLKEVVKYLKGDCLDYLIVSDTKLSKKSLEYYRKKGQHPVQINDLEGLKKISSARMILADVGDQHELVRHDSEKIKNVIAGLIKG